MPTINPNLIIRQHQAVASLSQLALTNTSLISLFERAANLLAKLLNVEFTKILRHLPDQNDFLLVAGHGWRSDIVPGKTIIPGGKESQAGYTFNSNHPIVVSDLTQESRFSGPELLLDHQVKSGISVIVASKPQPFGVLGVHSTQIQRFSKDDIHFVQAIANVLGLAIQQFHTRQQLDESHQQYEELFNLAPDVVYAINRQGLITSLSPSFRDITGWDTSTWHNKSFSNLIHPDDSDTAHHYFNLSLSGQKSKPYQLRIRTKSGSYISGEFRSQPHYRHGQIVGKIGIARDVTQRNLMEAELRRSRDQLDIIFQGVADGITVQNKSGRIIYANQAAAQSMGYDSPQQLISTPSSTYIKRYRLTDEQGKPFSWQHLPGQRALKGELKPEATIFYFDRDTQESRWVNIKARPIFDSKGKVQLTINLIHDITHHIQAEKQKDAFLGVVSHELKTPVASLKMYAQTLEKQLSSAHHPAAKHLNKIDQQLNKLTLLINDLLDTTQLQQGQLKLHQDNFDINQLIEEVVEDIQRTTTKHQIIIQASESIEVFADRERTSQVLVNLLTNAIKYSPQTGSILLHLRRHLDHLEVSITDAGVGIPLSQQPQLFQRFYRVSGANRRSYPGLGLGLYISAQIIKRQGGRIWVNSRPGHGSTFYFTLPLKASSDNSPS